MLVPWRKTTSLIAFLFFLVAPVALAGPGAFGVAAHPVCQPRVAHLSWSSSSGASSYRVFRGTLAISGVLPATTLAFNDTTTGSSYSVVATDSRGFTFTSNTVTPPAPNSSFCSGADLQVGQAAYCALSGPAIHLAWTAGADSSYFITDASGNFVALVDGSKSSFDITGLSSGKSVRYSVNNVDANNGQFVTTPACSGPPGSSTITATTSCVNSAVSVQLSWTAASAATQYRVDRDGVVIGTTTTARTFADTAVTAGHAYSYTISALNSSGSTESNTLAVTAATCVAPPGAFAASAATFCTTGASPAPAVHVTWTASSNAASYIVNRNGVAYSSSLSSATLALDDLNVTIGQMYAYTVTATNSGGSTLSSSSSVTITTATCPAPTPTTPALSESTICNDTSPSNHLSWTVSTNATSYIVFRNGAALSVSLPSSTLGYDDNAVVPGQSYAYFVRAANSGGSADSNTLNISLPTTICQPPPASFALTAKAICDISSTPAPVVRLTWTASANATGYSVFRADTKIADVTTTTLTDATNIVAGQIYKYFVRASGPGGTTDSNEFEVLADASVCQVPCGFACAASVVASARAQFPVRFALQQQTSCEGVVATWSFGDGTGSIDLAPTHAYASPGTFRWTVTAGIATSATCQNSGTITITAVPAPAKRRAVGH
jgi:fibronectin type 3 domain-containing protein